MSSPYRIKTIATSSGERLPLLLDDESGVPLFGPTAYVLTEVRARSRASNTIKAHLAAIEALLIHARTEGIDLGERVESGRLLELWEIDSLVAAIRQPMESLVGALNQRKEHPAKATEPKVVRLEALRQPPPKGSRPTIHRAFAANRLRIIRSYLVWLVDHRLARLSEGGHAWAPLLAKRQLLLDAIDARMLSGKGSPPEREGLSEQARATLLDVIDPDHRDNPWKDERVRRRNQLIILILYHTGLRRGELLALRLEDIDFRQNRLRVERRPDDPADPRIEQPTAKTFGRIIPLGQSLIDRIDGYIRDRRSIVGAQKHPFLFIETDQGRPLSSRALAEIFEALRTAAPELLGKLTAHVLRHDWNDRFSIIMEKRGVSEALEQKQRSFLMGWREGSGTAATYTKRYTRKRATETSLIMQSKAFAEESDDDSK